MPMLLYCVTEAEAASALSSIGVADLPVFRWAFPELDLFGSRAPDPAVWLKRELRASALEFHRVLGRIFETTAIVPFRFPTIFESDKQVEIHMQEHSAEYVGLLDRFRDSVQMEIRIGSDALSKSAQSGTEYLNARQRSIQAAEGFAADLRQKLEPISKEWRERTARNEVRAFALVPRDKTEQFEKTTGAIVVPAGLNARVSGPWPVSEFIGRP